MEKIFPAALLLTTAFFTMGNACALVLDPDVLDFDVRFNNPKVPVPVPWTEHRTIYPTTHLITWPVNFTMTRNKSHPCNPSI